MKKICLTILSLFFIILMARSQNFYQLSFRTINNDSISLNTYAGKKVLFLILPLNQSDSNFAQLQVFKNRYLDTIKIVGILSIEDGYQSSYASAIQSLYANMGIVLTEAMYTKKASVNQSSLMKWLTDKFKNYHFDMDAMGIGHKFFVSTGGRLFALMVPQTSLGLPIIDRIVHSTGP